MGKISFLGNLYFYAYCVMRTSSNNEFKQDNIKEKTKTNH